MTKDAAAQVAPIDRASPEGGPIGADAPEPKRSARSEVRQSFGWIVFGLVVVVLSWRMDRLEHQHINPYTVPGLLPGCLGLAVVLFGSLMLLRSWRAVRDQAALGQAEPPIDADLQRTERRRIGIVLALCLGYAGGLMGHGLPFWLATAIFIAVAIGVLQFQARGASGQRLRGLLFALVMGAATGAATTFVFQELFLVRLP